MKKVLSPEMVAHSWANQHQSEGRNSGNSLYFYGNTIYSYNNSFPIAKHVENAAGEKAILFTTRSYSVTTARHISIVRMAIPDYKNVIEVHNPNNEPQENFEQYASDMRQVLSNLERAKKPEKYLNEAKEIYSNAVKYATFLSLEIPVYLTALSQVENYGNLTEYTHKRSELEKQAEKALRRKAKQSMRAKLAKWRQFKIHRLYEVSRTLGFDYLRINEEKQRIETTQNVEIPLTIARKTFDWLQAIKECNECSYKILDFQVSEVTPKTLKVGCHLIERKEINSIAKKLGWV